ncbi:MBL fold metallo-hydrolase [Paenibacillus physcomitrellae]|uniref:MBL fold hydrolase n=1 Tax=Paenibacillus physcomitrellae TaxID=1619311 RepID=A0ABQ1GNS6_9BACL|nr:MBL fold metallo-hydrolase [Paenibacillus physcomitrellae]GGA47228.1 MBL fold hydrolase [Paenibacillus physcomitrellae]
MMKLHIWGGAGEHGRSCYLIAGERHQILLDCGVKKEDEGQYPLLDPEIIPQLTAVFLSHAHEDHSMALPLLYKYGYKGDIWTTKATVEQLSSYFASWRRYVKERGAELPYTEEQIAALSFRDLEDLAPALQWADLDLDEEQKLDLESDSDSDLDSVGAAAPNLPRIRLKWGRSGHLAGSVWLRLEVEGRRIFFSGDYSRESLLLAADSPLEGEAGEGGSPFSKGAVHRVHNQAADQAKPSGYAADLVIMDNAYGSDEEPQETKLRELERAVRNTLESGGHVLLPVPVYGRGQDLLVWASERLGTYNLIVEEKIWNGLQRLLEQPVWLQTKGRERIQQAINSSAGRVILPHNDEERLEALNEKGPSVIFTADGMMESPRARWYFKYLADHVRNTVIITGHAARHTFAQNILEGGMEEARCKFFNIRYKVHQGLSDVREMLREVPAEQTVLVHASKPKTDEVCEVLAGEGYRRIHSLKPGAELMF